MFGTKKITIMANDLNDMQLSMIKLPFWRRMKDVHHVIFRQSRNKLKVVRVVYKSEVLNDKIANDLNSIGELY